MYNSGWHCRHINHLCIDHLRKYFLNASLASGTVSSIPSGITITCILVDSFVCTLTVYTRVAGTFINICKKKTSIPNSNCNTNMIIPIHIVWTWIKTSPIMVLCSYMYLLSDHFKGCWNTHQYLQRTIFEDVNFCNRSRTWTYVCFSLSAKSSRKQTILN